MTQPICYLNGKYVSFDQACLPLNDLGIVRGYGIFDFLRTYNGVPFKLTEHIQRLQNSAKLIGLSLPWSSAEIEEITQNTLTHNHLAEANIRIVVTGGASADFITPLGQPSLMVIVTPVSEYPQEYYEQGIKVITVPIERFIPKAKSLNYISAIGALQQAKQTNAVEALYVNSQGDVLEGTTTNFFVFRGSQLLTPKEGILNGITRDVILELAKDRFEIVEQSIAYSQLNHCDEAFITSSTKEIMPVVQIDELHISQGKPGENTQTLMDLFQNYAKS
ncbi:aminotransferase class IV [Allocoleopsis franciscana]|uniref:Branched-chain amino acid aminotransferase/4-amino-4-deoxychorismate lyase n=1 Tax=Allocoleopsis franciscana PCC 7113 TaxID=1173027 RepID=K9WGC5_9CYAN|nr:aminotransferase class IV [Allocoleopsis franciscana]AFZ19243.1 branched-chain amino acid aminotransferase/4-amino-4-deoxychorismate lyase [Allocoleopsis franciscana PCC 7113]